MSFNTHTHSFIHRNEGFVDILLDNLSVITTFTIRCGYRDAPACRQAGHYLTFWKPTVFQRFAAFLDGELPFPDPLPVRFSIPNKISVLNSAGTENRTRVSSLARTHSTTKPYPQQLHGVV